jgi:P4 family phage/plasmid primase-like protien
MTARNNAPPPSLASLATLPVWVAWQLNQQDKKVPYSPATGRAASATDPGTWGTFSDACARVDDRIEKGYLPSGPDGSGKGGVGIVLGWNDTADFGLVGFDLDTCRDPATGEMTPWALVVLAKLNSYTEISPSGTGVKTFLRVNTKAEQDRIAKHLKATTHEFKMSRPGRGLHAPGVEVYATGRYFTVTGRGLTEYPSGLRSVTLTDLQPVLKMPDTPHPRRATVAITAAPAPPPLKPSAPPAPPPAPNVPPPGTVFAAPPSGRKAHGDASRSGEAMKIAGRIARKAVRSGADTETGSAAWMEYVEALATDEVTASWLAEDANGRQQERTWRRAVEEAQEAGSKARRGEVAATPVNASSDDLTEFGVADAFAAASQSLRRYCHTAKSWFAWDGTRWARDDAGQVRRAVVDFITAQTSGLDGAARCQTKRFADAVETLARDTPGIATRGEEWDRDPGIMATPGGVIDLRTGVMRAARPADMMTKRTAVTPQAGDCPLWRKLLSDATQGDAKLVLYLQCALGYALTGETREQVFFFLYGPGGNGKSVIMNAVAAVLGDYAGTAPVSAFIEARVDRSTNDLAGLPGLRMVEVPETPGNGRWDEQRLKRVTGGDRITARRLYENDATFHPQCKLFFTGNHKPDLRSTGDAMKRRVRLIPLEGVPPRVDTTLTEKLKAEWPTILQWLIEGCLQWRTFGGLPDCEAVTEATREYFEEQDVFGQWIAECCVTGPEHEERPEALLASFNAFLVANGHRETNSKQFAKLYQERGMTVRRLADGRRVVGVALRKADEARRGGIVVPFDPPKLTAH